jgi:hypothetical protein
LRKKDEATRNIIQKLLAEEEAKDFALEGTRMNRKGIEFTLVQVAPDLWQWRFQIGETVTMGKTKTKLRGLAARKAQMRIDRELRKPRDLNQRRTEHAGSSVTS